jgi:hypothetical protein
MLKAKRKRQQSAYWAHPPNAAHSFLTAPMTFPEDLFRILDATAHSLRVYKRMSLADNLEGGPQQRFHGPNLLRTLTIASILFWHLARNENPFSFCPAT